MCGLLYANDPAIDRDRFLAALEMMRHRGPDARGALATGRHQLGLDRLKIVDLDDRSNQPFLSSDGRFAIVYNGEIYNHRELAAAHGIPLRTTSDTEVVVELYARLGPRCVALLEGMFALVIVDTLSGSWFAARDRLGVKPLYLRRAPGGAILASEIAPILALGGVPRFDEFALRQYRKLRTFFNGRTAYAGIEMFPAAHWMLDGRLTRYWELPAGEREPPGDEELRSLIGDSVRRRRVADVPVGTLLSGGLDSTIVTALAPEPHTWTVGFADSNEFPWGRIAAGAIGTTHHEVLVERDEFVALAAEMVRRRREPLSVPNEVLLFAMCREARRLDTVILSGEGADELFFGYDRIFAWAARATALDVDRFSELYAYGSHEDREVVEDALAPFADRGGPLATVAAFFQVAHLHALLRRLDNAAMACSVEARVPFVDCHALVERMAGVPYAARTPGGEVKGQLKRAFADLVPEPIRRREKVGFPVPLASIDLPGARGATPMDRWLDFNLALLGAEPGEAARGGARDA